MDERPAVTCCQSATPEEIEQDPDLYRCDVCPVRMAIEDLQPENADAWGTFQRVSTRFLVDLHAGGLALDRLTADYSPDEFLDLVERLTVLYDIVAPVASDDPPK